MKKHGAAGRINVSLAMARQCFLRSSPSNALDSGMIWQQRAPCRPCVCSQQLLPCLNAADPTPGSPTSRRFVSNRILSPGTLNRVLPGAPSSRSDKFPEVLGSVSPTVGLADDRRVRSLVWCKAAAAAAIRAAAPDVYLTDCRYDVDSHSASFMAPCLCVGRNSS